jgi:hypothetical protein
MAPPPKTHLSALTDVEKLALVRLLSASNETILDKAWFAKQTYYMERLPKVLLRPKNPISRTLSAIKKPLIHLNIGEERAVLCKVHKPLNPHIIRRLFISLGEECSLRNKSFIDAAESDLPPNIHTWIRRLESINSLWMSAELYMIIFMRTDEGLHYDHDKSCCEACIIATIGSNIQMILDLHASVLSRDFVNRGEPHLLRFLDDWLANIGGSGLVKGNKQLGGEIMKIRKKMLSQDRPRSSSTREPKSGRTSLPSARNLRRFKSTSRPSTTVARRSDSKKKQTASNGEASYRYIPPSVNPYTDASSFQASPSRPSNSAPDIRADNNGTEHDVKEQEDTEQPAAGATDSIIDYYFSRLPSQNFEAMNAAKRPERIHPAFRGSMFGGSVAGRSVAGTEHHNSQNKRPGRPATAYSASVYSDHPSKHAPSYFEKRRNSRQDNAPPPVLRLPERYTDNSDPYGLKSRWKPPLDSDSLSCVGSTPKQEPYRARNSAVDSEYDLPNRTSSVSNRSNRAFSTAESIWIYEPLPESVRGSSIAETTESTHRGRGRSRDDQKERDDAFRKLTGGLTEAEFKAELRREQSKIADKNMEREIPLTMLNSKGQGEKLIGKDRRERRRASPGADSTRTGGESRWSQFED